MAIFLVSNFFRYYFIDEYNLPIDFFLNKEFEKKRLFLKLCIKKAYNTQMGHMQIILACIFESFVQVK